MTLWSNFVVDIFSTTSADNRSQRVQFCCESHLRLCSFVSENLVDFSSVGHDAKHIFVHHLKIVPSGSLLRGGYLGHFEILVKRGYFGQNFLMTFFWFKITPKRFQKV